MESEFGTKTLGFGFGFGGLGLVLNPIHKNSIQFRNRYRITNYLYGLVSFQVLFRFSYLSK